MQQCMCCLFSRRAYYYRFWFDSALDVHKLEKGTYGNCINNLSNNNSTTKSNNSGMFSVARSHYLRVGVSLLLSRGTGRLWLYPATNDRLQGEGVVLDAIDPNLCTKRTYRVRTALCAR